VEDESKKNDERPKRRVRRYSPDRLLRQPVALSGGETTPDALVPVLVVDLDDKEADKGLATFDPLAAMAEPDETQLDALPGQYVNLLEARLIDARFNLRVAGLRNLQLRRNLLLG